MNKIFYCLILLVLLVTGCNRKKEMGNTAAMDTIPDMIMQIQECSRLYTAEVHVHKIVTHQDEKTLKGKLLGQDISWDIPATERKIAIPMDATLKAYIDFSQFTENNIRRKGNTIEIILPDPRIVLTSSRINYQEIKRDIAPLRGNYSDKELSDYEQQGRRQIIRQLPESGILNLARDNAARILIPIIEMTGYKENNITISFRKNFTGSDIPSLLDNSNVEHGKDK